MGNFSLTETPEQQAKKPLLEGISLYEREEIPAAFRFFEKVVIDHPKSAYAYLYKAKCHFYFENYEIALQDLRKSLQLDNSIRETYLLKATCHFNIEDYDEAMLEYRRASQFYLDKNAEVRRRIGELELKRGNFKSANDAFAKAAKLGDNEAKSYLTNMDAYYKQP
jgi:tetratricopeptide (TPR) repeat protein